MRHQRKSSTIDHSYQYHDVPMSVANEFQKAKSAGKYFHAEIRDQYKTVKL